MKIGKYYVSSTPDNGIERPNEQGQLVECEGYYCNIFDDPDCENFIDDFCLAVGHEIPDASDEALEKGIRWFMTTYYDVDEEHEQEVEETTDMITAEDIVEQTVYAANAPDCCAEEHAENMLGMLGANIVDEDIYHDEDECPKLEEAEPDDYKQALQDALIQEYSEFESQMLSKTPQEIYSHCRQIFFITEMMSSLCDDTEYEDEIYKSLYQDRGAILSKLYEDFKDDIDASLGSPEAAEVFIENYCNRYHRDIMNGDESPSLAMGGLS